MEASVKRGAVCQEMQRLMDRYTEAAMAHAGMGAAHDAELFQTQRDSAWAAWSEHVSDHDGEWPGL